MLLYSTAIITANIDINVDIIAMAGTRFSALCGYFGLVTKSLCVTVLFILDCSNSKLVYLK